MRPGAYLAFDTKFFGNAGKAAAHLKVALLYFVTRQGVVPGGVESQRQSGVVFQSNFGNLKRRRQGLYSHTAFGRRTLAQRVLSSITSDETSSPVIGSCIEIVLCASNHINLEYNPAPQVGNHGPSETA